MRRSVFDARKKSHGIRVDSFFIELALIMPVFALSCCAVLSMLAAAAKRADNEEMKASAVACAQAWCEVYSVEGSIDRTVNEVFGDAAAECISSGKAVFYTDKTLKYVPHEGNFAVTVTESCRDTKNGSLVYGQLYSSDITISFNGESITQTAVCYKPHAASINMGTEAADDEQ